MEAARSLAQTRSSAAPLVGAVRFWAALLPDAVGSSAALLPDAVRSWAALLPDGFHHRLYLDSEQRGLLQLPEPQGGTEPPPWLRPLHRR